MFVYKVTNKVNNKVRKPIAIIDTLENTTTEYLSIRQMSRETGISRGVIKECIKAGRLFKNRYKFVELGGSHER